MVPYVGDNEDYSQTLTGLSVGLSYRIQIQALDRNSYVLFTTPEVGAQSQCQAPTHPPTHLAIDAPDSRHVRLTWNAPVQSTWRCSVIQVEIQVGNFMLTINLFFICLKFNVSRNTQVLIYVL